MFQIQVTRIDSPNVFWVGAAGKGVFLGNSTMKVISSTNLQALHGAKKRGGDFSKGNPGTTQ